MKRLLFWTLGSLFALSVIVVFAVNWIFWPTHHKPLEDPYWAISQYESTLERLRGDLYAVMTGTVPGTNVRSTLAMAMSKSRILTRESAAHDVLLAAPVFANAVKDFVAFEDTVLKPQLQHVNQFDEAQAVALLPKVEDMLATLAAVSPEVWQMQVEGNEEAFNISESRSTWNIIMSVSFGFVASLAVAMFLFFNIRLRDKNKQLAEQTSELESSIAEKNRFMGMVSHELKSPLQTITLSAEALSQPMASNDRANVISRIQRASVALNLQLSDLLTLARSESGKLEYRPDLFEVRELINEITDIESQVAHDKELQLRVHSPREPVFVMADSGRLAQILRNLVNNAIKYTDSGMIVVSLIEATASELTFTVRDTGPGMPSGFVPLETQTFKRFGNMDRREGYGVGLMIAFSLTEYLGGRLQYESDSGGTSFTLTIPATRQDDVPTEVTAGSHRILLVDDMPDLLSSLRTVCEAHGYATDVAASAAVAANLMATTAYDAALIDINMPVRRGDELARDFRRGGLMANRNCLLVGMSADRHPHLAGKSPFDLMLEKPIHIKSVLRELQRRGKDSIKEDRY